MMAISCGRLRKPRDPVESHVLWIYRHTVSSGYFPPVSPPNPSFLSLFLSTAVLGSDSNQDDVRSPSLFLSLFVTYLEAWAAHFMCSPLRNNRRGLDRGRRVIPRFA